MHSHWLIYVTRLTASNCNSLLQSFTSNYSTVKILFEIGCKVTYLTTFLRTVTLNYFLFEFPNKETGTSLLETPLGRAHNGTSQYGPFPYELDFSLDLHRYLVYPNLPRAKLRHTLEMFFEENLDFLEVWAFKLVWKRRHIFRPSNNGSHTRHPTENERVSERTKAFYISCSMLGKQLLARKKARKKEGLLPPSSIHFCQRKYLSDAS